MKYRILYIYKYDPKNMMMRLISPDKYFWTMCSDDTEYCKSYRDKAQVKYCGALLEEIGKIECKDSEECKTLQLNINSTFKPWTRGGGMKITLDIDDSLFMKNCMGIYNNTYGLEDALSDYGRSKTSGTVYLARCVNGKLKIGISTNMDRRKEDLKNEERNQVIDIVDTFESDDINKDEAVLHELCASYKANGNNGVRWLQECGNSELFTECNEVINIWNEYKSKLILDGR